MTRGSPRRPSVVVRCDAIGAGRYVSAGSAELAYLDPPFGVRARFSARTRAGQHRARGEQAYDDLWPSLEAYLAWLEPRLSVVHELLSPSGTLWLHLDHRAVHDAKALCDRVFGRQRFQGEIIWVPGNGSKSRSGPGMTHQTLLVYTRGERPVWNARDPVLREPYAVTSQSMHFKRTDASGRRYRNRIVNGKTYRYYADEGRALGSVWTDCPAMRANTPLLAEATGYPTQKPLTLLERIVRASSRPGSLVVDLFCGSGTTLVAAAKHDRAFFGCDIGELAVETTCNRLRAAHVAFSLQDQPPE